MTRPAKMIAAPLVLGITLLAVWLYVRSEETVPESPAPQIESANTITSSPLPGGHGLKIEVFNVAGGMDEGVKEGRLWRLDLESAVMENNAAIRGDSVSAEYLPAGSRSVLVADAILYESSLPRLIFHGNVRLSGRGYVLTCSELTWEGRTRSFSTGGEYILTRGDSIMRGQGLWASEDFKTIRSIGSTSGRGDFR